MTQAPSTDEMENHSELIASFGSIALKNTEVNHGGIGNYYAKFRLKKLKQSPIEIINISLIRDYMGAEWWPIIPNSDVALMLGIAHTLHTENLHHRDFLQTHCVGYETFSAYLLGKEDGIEKSANWRENCRASHGNNSQPVLAAGRTLRTAMVDGCRLIGDVRRYRPPGRWAGVWIWKYT